MIIRGRTSQIFSLTVIILFFYSNNPAAAQVNERMIFLHCKMKGGTITLLNTTTGRGHVKSAGAAVNRMAMTCEVHSNSGALLWMDATNNPMKKRLEYEDPERPGMLKAKVVDLAEAEFTLRIPVVEGAAEVLLYAPAENVPGKKGATLSRKMLGRLRWPERREER